MRVVLPCNFPLISPKLVLKLKVSKLNAIDLFDGTIITSHLTVDAKVKDITADAFQNWDKRENCPVSKVLNAAISSTATLA
jgi:hypothetical protein